MRQLLQPILTIGMIVTSVGVSVQAQESFGVPTLPDLPPLSEMQPIQERVLTAPPEGQALLMGKAVQQIGLLIGRRIAARELRDFSQCLKVCSACDDDRNDEESCEKCEECKAQWFGGWFGGEPAPIDPTQPYLWLKLTPEESNWLNRVVDEWSRLPGPTQ